MSYEGRYVLAAVGEGRWGSQNHVTGSLLLFDLQKGVKRRITSHGSEFNSVAIDGRGASIGTIDRKGIVRIGKSSGEEPHLFFSDEGSNLAISPDRKWFAFTMAADVQLRPMPDLSKSPLHILPYDQLKAKLHSLTNLRVVTDTTSATGYRLEIGPFPGWGKPPTR